MGKIWCSLLYKLEKLSNLSTEPLMCYHHGTERGLGKKDKGRERGPAREGRLASPASTRGGEEEL